MFMAFYRFARIADDIADHPALSAEEKVAGSTAWKRCSTARRATICRPPWVCARACSRPARPFSIAATILHAFRMDATKLRYDDWADLINYCRYSASPVGRQLLDLHGESQDTWPPSDALCSALQVLNHLQDCAEDHRNLDRVYLPRQDLDACGASIPELQAGRLSSGLRCVIDRLLDGTDKLIAEARKLPPRVKSPGLRRECAVIVNLAERLSGHLRRGDPLATRVKLKPVDFGAALLIGVWRGR